MIQINENFLQLPGRYLFSEIAQRVNAYTAAHPGESIIRMGIGDVTRPLAGAVTEAMHRAVDEMTTAESFRGYGPEQGYDFLIQTILKHDFLDRGIELSVGDIFVSDGCKSDMGNIGDLFSQRTTVAVTDPVYPVYVDSNVMGGRAGSMSESGKWSQIVYLPCTGENHFVPELPESEVDLIYLCLPNNPTGTTLKKSELKCWVDYALKTGALIIFDAAYEAFITEEDVPRSIYEIEGAEACAIEFRSFSKTAGFTGIRCGYTVVPEKVTARTANGERVALNPLWNRRQTTKFNGVSYITQRAAEAVYSPIGKAECMESIRYYMENAAIIRTQLTQKGLEVYGGINAPYIWFKTPDQIPSWDFFDRMLNEIQVIGTPGLGFGPSGEGYVRLTAFGDRQHAIQAMDRIRNWKI